MSVGPENDEGLPATARLFGLALVAMPLFVLSGHYSAVSIPKTALLVLLSLILVLPSCFTPSSRFPRSLLIPLLILLAILALQFSRSLNPAAVSLVLIQQFAGFAIALGVCWGIERGGTSLISGHTDNPVSSDWEVCLCHIGRRDVGTIPVSSLRRCGWIGLLLAGLIWMIIGRMSGSGWNGFSRGRRLGMVPALICMLLVLIALPRRFVDLSASRLDERKETLASTVMSSAVEGGDRGRLSVWSTTLSMIAADPLLGVGLGNWGAVFPRYDGGKTLSFASDPRRPHNDFLWLAAESGITGLLAYLLFLGALVVLIRRVIRDRDPTVRLTAIAAAASMGAYLGHSLFSFPREWAPPSMLFWVCVGLVSGLSGGRRSILNRIPAVGAVLVIGLGLVVCVRAMRFDRLLYSAVMARQDADWRNQVAYAGRALEYGAFDHRAHLIRGNGLMHIGQGHAASRAFERLLEFTPYSAPALGNLGRAYLSVGAVNKARKVLERALDLMPGEPVLVNNLALVYEREGYPDAALRARDETNG